MDGTKNLSANAIVFMFYSMIGAIFEHVFYAFSDKTKALANPILTGFPLYGFGAYLVVFVNKLLLESPLKTPEGIPGDIILFFIFGAAMTMLEYAVGVYVGAGKNSKDGNGNVYAWDYSKKKYNYKGIITPIHFVIWGVLGLVISKVHPSLLRAATAAVESL